MTIGTKSVLYGAHCFFLHPWFVALAWWRLFGRRKVYIGYAPGYPGTWRWKLGFRGGPTFASIVDPRLWLAFVVHDLGYFGKPNMDGAEGEQHPYFGARLLSRLFDPRFPQVVGSWEYFGRWGTLALYHSRYLSKTLGHQPSPLCAADKLAISLTPAWLYLPMVRATGELQEYMAHAHHRVKGNEALSADERRLVTSASERDWYRGVQEYCRRWALEHADGKRDTWTSSSRQRATVGPDGVWR